MVSNPVPCHISMTIGPPWVKPKKEGLSTKPGADLEKRKGGGAELGIDLTWCP